MNRFRTRKRAKDTSDITDSSANRSESPSVPALKSNKTFRLGRKNAQEPERKPEFDLAKGIWTISQERFKSNAAHIVPLTDDVLALLKDAWQEELPLAPEVVDFESNPDSLHALNREENVLVSHLEMRSMGFTGLITICLPMTTIEPFLQEPTAYGPMRHGRSALPRRSPALSTTSGCRPPASRRSPVWSYVYTISPYPIKINRVS
jgi:hypothetical protein